MEVGSVMTTVMIGEDPMTIEELVSVARGAPVRLTPEARSLIRASRSVVEDVLATGEPVYGLNTGVGHMKDVRLPDEELRRSQELLLVTHAGGIGPPASTKVVRAAMVTRLSGIARGGSGATEAAADVLAGMLNSGVHPVVPAEGSVGAGDLGQMAAIGLVAIGRGLAEQAGEVLPGAEALRRAGVEPLVLQPKDGLTLVSANGVSIGHGALVVIRADDLAVVADVAVALSMEAIGGNPSVTLPSVGAAKPYPGQIQACRSIRAALAGSFLLEPGAPRSVQDPLSFRVAPQVHGALREFIASTRRAVETELNSMSDNPLVDLESRTMVHNGNFHPMVLALAFDGLRVAVAHAGQVSERRISHLWDSFFENLARRGRPGGWGPGGPGPRGSGPGGGDSPPGAAMPEFMGVTLRYAAAALVAELKQLASPATLDVPSLDIGVEDHATGAPLSVRKAKTSLEVLGGILAIELLLARDVLSILPARPPLGEGTAAVFRVIEEALATDLPDRSPATVHRAMQAQILGAMALGFGKKWLARLDARIDGRCDAVPH
jgi:histidine ammonia-lyase